VPRADRRDRRRRRRGRFKTPLTPTVILLWAQDHFQKTGRWPTVRCGRVLAAPQESWFNVDQCLRKGLRGLAQGDSLPRLLERLRGRRRVTRPPALTEDQIAAWAEEHRARTGRWPGQHSGPVEGRPGESWAGVDASLREGRRGLPVGGSLARLLEVRFGARNRAASPPLSEEKIAAWADEHRARTGRWPGIKSGPVAASPGDSWCAVDDALRRGARGLPGGSSLTRLLARLRGARNHADLPPLTETQIAAWAAEHHARTDAWPTREAGPIPGTSETWGGIAQALHRGRRGLPGGDSLGRLLARHGCGGAAGRGRPGRTGWRGRCRAARPPG
jgi:hypothetical protein